MSKARDLANAADVLDDVSATELSYVNGVTSAIQTQLNAKQAVVSGVNDTEIGYLDGVSSAIQTQLDGKTAKNTLTTTGDIYYASSANTPARLGIGSTGDVLTVASGVPSWAAPAGGGGLTLLSTTSLSGSSTSVSITGTGYVGLFITVTDFSMSGNDQTRFRLNSDTGSNYRWTGTRRYSTTDLVIGDGTTTSVLTSFTPASSNADSFYIISIPNSEQTASYKGGWFQVFAKDGGGGNPDCLEQGAFSYKSTSAISNFTFGTLGGATFSAGEIKVYGVK